jgi:hypothetical protein
MGPPPGANHYRSLASAVGDADQQVVRRTIGIGADAPDRLLVKVQGNRCSRSIYGPVERHRSVAHGILPVGLEAEPLGQVTGHRLLGRPIDAGDVPVGIIMSCSRVEANGAIPRERRCVPRVARSVDVEVLDTVPDHVDVDVVVYSPGWATTVRQRTNGRVPTRDRAEMRRLARRWSGHSWRCPYGRRQRDRPDTHQGC